MNIKWAGFKTNTKDGYVARLDQQQADNIIILKTKN